jgi:hypothetical protein
MPNKKVQSYKKQKENICCIIFIIKIQFIKNKINNLTLISFVIFYFFSFIAICDFTFNNNNINNNNFFKF